MKFRLFDHLSRLFVSHLLNIVYLVNIANNLVNIANNLVNIVNHFVNIFLNFNNFLNRVVNSQQLIVISTEIIETDDNIVSHTGKYHVKPLSKTPKKEGSNSVYFGVENDFPN